ncbi:hypothetical protein AVEN_84702-1, partial [Araneus ventricosus]
KDGAPIDLEKEEKEPTPTRKGVRPIAKRWGI